LDIRDNLGLFETSYIVKYEISKTYNYMKNNIYEVVNKIKNSNNTLEIYKLFIILKKISMYKFGTYIIIYWW